MTPLTIKQTRLEKEIDPSGGGGDDDDDDDAKGKNTEKKKTPY